MDISKTIEPKSNQLNAEDFISGPLTFTILNVSLSSAPEQPVQITFAGGFRPWKPCKTMRRVLVVAWGPDAEQYIGRSLTLYREPSVLWAGEACGGIRISAMSHIAQRISVKLAASSKSRTLHEIDVLKAADIPPTDEIAIARRVAKGALGRGWTKEQIEAAMQGVKIEDMTQVQRGTFMRDLQHEPGTISKPEDGVQGTP